MEYDGNGKLKARWSTTGFSDSTGGAFNQNLGPLNTAFEEWEYDGKRRPSALLLGGMHENGLDLEPDAFYRFEYAD